MYLGSRVLSDGAAFHGFLRDELGAAAVSARLADVASEVHARCTTGDFPLGATPADGRRWACALIGQVASDALLLAATPRQAAAHCLPWAEQRFEASVSNALARSGANTFKVHGSDVESLVDGFRTSIGDVEQSLAGEDHGFDDMLKRGGAAPARVVTPRPAAAASLPAVAPVAVAREPPRTAQHKDADAIERFIVARLARELKVGERSIDPRRSIFDYGLDSVTTVMLSASLEEWLGIELQPEAAYDVPVIRQFARYVADRQGAGAGGQGIQAAGVAAAQASPAGGSD
jgi:acyl carrier protein